MYLSKFWVHSLPISILSLVSLSSFAATDLSYSPLNGEKMYFAGDETLEENRYGAWGLVHANHFKQKAMHFTPGFRGSTFGAGLGLDWQVNDPWLLGLGIRFDYTDLDSSNYSGTNMDFASTRGFLYTRYDFTDRWFVNGTVSFAFNSYNTKRNVYFYHTATNIQIMEAIGDISGHQWGAELSTGYQWSCNKWHFLPQIGIQYTHLSLGAYNEHSAQAGNRRFADQDLDALKLMADLKIAYQNEFSEAQLLPYIHGSVLYDTEAEQQEFTANVLGGPTAFPSFGPRPPHVSYKIGVGFALFGKHDVTLNMAYDYTFKHNFHDHSGLINVHYDWDVA